MKRLGPRTRAAALTLKVAGFLVGVFSVCFALGFVYDELAFLSEEGGINMGDVLVVLAAIALALSGVALVAQLPESFRARFRRFPESIGRARPVYGLGTMLAVGIGATLGSPLFILIPENILQYEVVSIASLALASILSVAMAKVYTDMYRTSRALGLTGVGGPSFTRMVVGTRSVRYFVSRLSMWVSNTALAAYTKIVFLIFVLDPQYLPAVLTAYGMSPVLINVTVYSIASAFVAWTILNILFEQRYLRLLGALQIAMTAALLFILVYHSAVLGASGSWNLYGLFTAVKGYSWVPALVVNTGYLYLLFFGFQEIQSLERDAVEESGVPVISWVKKGFKLGRTAYFGAAMVLSVVVAAAVNIFYGLAVYASVSSGVALPQGTAIPALYLAGNLLGPAQELLMAVAFLIATVTTFVPAFLAAARHLGALGEDGYMPKSLANLSWAFTLVAILLLAIGPQDFLVNITDFMVLISLGIISLSALWLRKKTAEEMKLGRTLPLAVGLSCFLFGGAVYFINPSVVVFGAIAIMFAYLIFDVIELGTLGAQLFLSVFGFVSLLMLTAFGHTLYTGGVIRLLTNPLGSDPNTFLSIGLLISSAILASNVMLDVRILRRTLL
ncbi:MAG: APC family permease [Nitrososphaerota archaeon]|nr:APC family permease [Nitrososphaerota archaeon]MDG7024640.1 APC family permease [Nitrososphaerota archaeon]